MEDAYALQSIAAEPFAPARARPKAVLRARMVVIMLVLDALALAAGFGIASQLNPFHNDSGNALAQLAMITPIFWVIALFNRAYAPSLIKDHWSMVGRALYALGMAAAAIVLIAFFVKASAEWSRTTFAIGTGLSLLFLTVQRYVFGRHAAALVGGEPYQVVVIRDPIGAMGHEAMQRLPRLGKALALDAFDPTQLDPATLDRFAGAIAHADRVIVYCSAERRQSWALALKGANVQGEVVAPELDAIKPIGVAHHGGERTLIISRGPLGLKDRLVKRAFDIAVAGSALFFLAPLLVVVALIVRLQDNGPVFFVQTRVGRSNRLFKMMKFRSMYVQRGDSLGNRSASRDDDRITPFGRIIRATSIDEIPQLINVLKGDMSIVGPRPHALGSTAEDLLFWHIDERYWHRHAIKPGLTGLAQVRGFRGATQCKADLTNRLQSDLEYLDNWTIWRDLIIVARTFGVLLHRNAF